MSLEYKYGTLISPQQFTMHCGQLTSAASILPAHIVIYIDIGCTANTYVTNCSVHMAKHSDDHLLSWNVKPFSLMNGEVHYHLVDQCLNTSKILCQSS